MSSLNQTVEPGPDGKPAVKIQNRAFVEALRKWISMNKTIRATRTMTPGRLEAELSRLPATAAKSARCVRIRACWMA